MTLVRVGIPLIPQVMDDLVALARFAVSDGPPR